MQTLEFPYAGTSGWAGSDTSRERAEQQDSDGTFTRRQKQALQELWQAGERGLTWKELGFILNLHHGQASGVLSVLHKQERIARLEERRNRCAVYVVLDFVKGRATSDAMNTRASLNAATLEAIRVLHCETIDSEITGKTYCKECQYEYPCDTIKLVEQNANN